MEPPPVRSSFSSTPSGFSQHIARIRTGGQILPVLRSTESPSSSKSCTEARLHFSKITSPVAQQLSQSGAESALETLQDERPVKPREHHFRKAPKLAASTVQAKVGTGAFAPLRGLVRGTQGVQNVPVALVKTGPANPVLAGGRSSRERKPKVSWKEYGFQKEAPEAAGMGPGNWPASKGPSQTALNTNIVSVKSPALRGLSPGSSGSADSAQEGLPGPGRRVCAPTAPRHMSSSSELESLQQPKRRRKNQPKPARPGGPCVVCGQTKSTTWRRGNERGMFPGEAMCNSHGTLDMRGRLHLYLNKAMGGRSTGLSDEGDEAGGRSHSQARRRAAGARPIRRPKTLHGTEQTGCISDSGIAKVRGMGMDETAAKIPETAQRDSIDEVKAAQAMQYKGREPASNSPPVSPISSPTRMEAGTGGSQTVISNHVREASIMAGGVREGRGRSAVMWGSVRDATTAEDCKLEGRWSGVGQRGEVVDSQHWALESPGHQRHQPLEQAKLRSAEMLASYCSKPTRVLDSRFGEDKRGDASSVACESICMGSQQPAIKPVGPRLDLLASDAARQSRKRDCAAAADNAPVPSQQPSMKHVRFTAAAGDSAFAADLKVDSPKNDASVDDMEFDMANDIEAAAACLMGMQRKFVTVKRSSSGKDMVENATGMQH